VGWYSKYGRKLKVEHYISKTFVIKVENSETLSESDGYFSWD
jgi:hypothetical protein